MLPRWGKTQFETFHIATDMLRLATTPKLQRRRTAQGCIELPIVYRYFASMHSILRTGHRYCLLLIAHCSLLIAHSSLLTASIIRKLNKINRLIVQFIAHN
jgi:hypothetical protein